MRTNTKKIALLMIGLISVVFCIKGPFQIHAAPAKPRAVAPAPVAVKSIPVFCYHRVIPNPTSEYDLSPAQLEAHFQYFKSNGYQPITAAQFLEYQKKPALFPAKPIVISFDDGSKSNYTDALPILKKYGFKATFYIFPNATRGSKKRWLGWEELAEISKAGMDLGSHALSHPYLTARGEMTEDEYKVWLEKEVTQSKKMLEDNLKIKVTSLAYPFGLYDQQVEAAAIKAGYQGMFNINPGPNSSRDNPYRLKRRIMANNIGPKSLANILAEQPLEIDVLSPADGLVTANVPEIRFRVKTPGVTSVKVEVSKYQAVLTPDKSGVCTYTLPGKLKRAFWTISVRGKDAKNNACTNSWNFWYRPAEDSGKGATPKGKY